MEQFKSADEILDFAIGKEQEAHDLYAGLAAQMTREDMAAVFSQFAAEELGHKAKLQEFRRSGVAVITAERVADLKIGDYLIDVEPGANMGYQQALILAMKAEKAAYRLYHDLALQASSPAFKEIFLSLANEEAKHKLRFEIEYDEQILKEN